MKKIGIIGGGPTGMMTAIQIQHPNAEIHLFEGSNHLGTKFLVAGKGGFNLSNNEPQSSFHEKYFGREELFKEFLTQFSSNDLREFLNSIDIPTYVGSSNRIFPEKDITPGFVLKQFKKQLEKNKVNIHLNKKCISIQKQGQFQIQFEDEESFECDILVIATGGSSWKQTGSDGKMIEILKDNFGLNYQAFDAINCGLNINWSEFILSKHTFEPIKNVRCSIDEQSIHGDIMITDYGIEGTPIYYLSCHFQENQSLLIDFKPNLSKEQIINLLDKRNLKKSLSNFFQQKLKFNKTAIALLHEANTNLNKTSNERLAQAIKSSSFKIESKRPIDEAISVSGGIQFDQLNNQLQVNQLKNVFIAGEILDWKAPTGGYLLQACFTTASIVAKAISK